jgi:cytochrome c-type biogenesis protein CcmE
VTRRVRVRYLVAGLLVAGALGLVLAEGIGSALQYFQTASQAVRDRAQLGSQSFNIEGAVVPGSIHRTGSTVAFKISSGSTVVDVVSHGNPSQLFQGGIPVVLVGHFVNGRPPRQLDPAGSPSPGFYFSSDQIMVKHSAQYVAAHPDRVRSPYPISSRP